MANSVLKIPKDTFADYDFIAFSFGGKHSYEDFQIYRVSDGNTGYNENLAPNMQDKTLDVPGADGQYFLGTQHKTKVFNVKFAFDNLTESKLQELKLWFAGKDIQDLWFSEAPHKIYSAKVTGTPQIQAIAFSDGTNERVYRGTGSVTFTCYHPYAHTPKTLVTTSSILRDGKSVLIDTESSGREFSGYYGFPNYNDIKKSLPKYGTPEDNPVNYSNPAFGDMPATFVAHLSRAGFKTIKLFFHSAEVADDILTVATTDKINFTYEPVYDDDEEKIGRKLLVEWEYDSLNDKYSKSKTYTWSDVSNLAMGWTRSAEQIGTGDWPDDDIQTQFVEGDTIEETEAYTEYRYTCTLDGTGEEKESYKIPDLDLHLQWSKLCTVTFYKSLNDMAIVLYGDGSLSADSIKAITGPQELYSCDINTIGNYYTPVDVDCYRGVFSNNGVITQRLVVPQGTKLRINVASKNGWEHKYLKWNEAQCSITDNKVLTRVSNDNRSNQSYVFVVDQDKEVLFDWIVKDISIEREIGWFTFKIYLTGKSYWDCKIQNKSTGTIEINIPGIIDQIGDTLNWLKEAIETIRGYLNG